MERIEVAVDALVMVEWSGALRWDAGSWRADLTCVLAPYEGDERVMGRWLRQLEVLGFQARHTTTFEYPGVQVPSMQQVAADSVAWIEAVHDAAVSTWVGKRFGGGELAAPEE